MNQQKPKNHIHITGCMALFILIFFLLIWLAGAAAIIYAIIP